MFHRLGRWLQRFSSAAHYDFCPQLNRYVYWLKSPLGWFIAAAVASALIGFAVAPQGWLLCGVISTVAVLATAWPWICMSRLSAHLRFDQPRCVEGEEVPAVLTVTNRWPWPVWGLLVEAGGQGPDQPGPEQAVPADRETATDQDTEVVTTALARISPWSETDFDFTFRPPRRGVYPALRPRVATGFPLGLGLVRRPIELSGELLAWPRQYPVGFSGEEGTPQVDSQGIWVDRPGQDGDVVAARPYRTGDSMRRVHWAQTARRDRLIVCDRQSAVQEQIIITLDELAFREQSARQQQCADEAIRVLASLAVQLADLRHSVICEFQGERHTITPTPLGRRRFLDRLARWKPTSGNLLESRQGWPSTRASQFVLTTPDRFRQLGDGGTSRGGTRGTIWLLVSHHLTAVDRQFQGASVRSILAGSSIDLRWEPGTASRPSVNSWQN